VAEIALTVIDAYQRRGLGTLLLALLYLLVKACEVQMLRAFVVLENATMLKWLTSLGAVSTYEQVEYRLSLPVHQDLPQTPSGEKFKHAIRVVQTALSCFGALDGWYLTFGISQSNRIHQCDPPL